MSGSLGGKPPYHTAIGSFAPGLAAAGPLTMGDPITGYTLYRGTKMAQKDADQRFFPEAPKVPEPPAVPSLADTADAALEERRRRLAAGRASTVLTGSRLGGGAVATKTLTGQ